MAITAMSSGLRCARGAALKAMRAGRGAKEPAAMEAGTNPNIASPEKGEFVREALGRSPLSKWVYSETCQAANGRPGKKVSLTAGRLARNRKASESRTYPEFGKRLPDEVYHISCTSQCQPPFLPCHPCS